MKGLDKISLLGQALGKNTQNLHLPRSGSRSFARQRFHHHAPGRRELWHAAQPESKPFLKVQRDARNQTRLFEITKNLGFSAHGVEAPGAAEDRALRRSF